MQSWQGKKKALKYSVFNCLKKKKMKKCFQFDLLCLHMDVKVHQKSRGFYPFFKRLFDICFSLFCIILFLPLFLLIILCIKIDSRGPVFYLGKRLGRYGKIITMVKFRTMYVGAEKHLQDILKSNPDMCKEWEVFQKIRNDPRRTSIGKFLRKTSLDELPQFFNVLKGDLSVVGPRPYYICNLPSNNDSLVKEHAHLVLSIKPGLTALWQISGRSLLSYQDRVKLDILYIKKRSFFYDLLLILKTMPVLFFISKKGAF